MTPFELVAALDDLTLNQKALARVCGVEPVEVWRWVNGRTRVPRYVRTILTLLKTRDPHLAINGKLVSWRIEHHHVFRNGMTFNDLLKRYHPDRNKRDTTREMQVIIQFRDHAPKH